MPFTEADLGHTLTRREAAEMLEVSLGTLDRMLARQEIAFGRVGIGRGQIRISRAAVLDHLNRSEEPVKRKPRPRTNGRAKPPSS